MTGPDTNFDRMFVNQLRAILITLFFSLLFIFWYPPSSHAKNLVDYHGVFTFYGKSNWTEVGPHDQGNYEWINISYFAGKNITSWLSLEGVIGPGFIRADNNKETGTIESRLLLNFHTTHFFIRFGGGAAYLFDASEIEDLYDAEMFAIASFSIGYQCVLNEISGTPGITIGYATEHISDPFKGGEDGDNGLNVGALSLAITWTF